MTLTMLAPMASRMSMPNRSVSDGTTRIPPPTPARAPITPAAKLIAKTARSVPNVMAGLRWRGHWGWLDAGARGEHAIAGASGRRPRAAGDPRHYALAQVCNNRYGCVATGFDS